MLLNTLYFSSLVLAASSMSAQTTTTMDPASQCSQLPIGSAVYAQVFTVGPNVLCCVGNYGNVITNGVTSQRCAGNAVTISGSGIQSSTISSALLSASSALGTITTTINYNAAPTAGSVKEAVLGVVGAAVMAGAFF